MLGYNKTKEQWAQMNNIMIYLTIALSHIRAIQLLRNNENCEMKKLAILVYGHNLLASHTSPLHP